MFQSFGLEKQKGEQVLQPIDKAYWGHNVGEHDEVVHVSLTRLQTSPPTACSACP